MFGPLEAKRDPGFDPRLTALGVYRRSDGDLLIDEWRAVKRPTTSVPFLIVSAIHMSVDRLDLSRLVCGDASASMQALTAQMQAFARIDHAMLLDTVGSASRKSIENYASYSANDIGEWRESAEVEVAQKRTPFDT